MNQSSISRFGASVAILLLAACSGGGGEDVAQGSVASQEPVDNPAVAPADQAKPGMPAAGMDAPSEVDAANFDSMEVVTTDLCSVRMNDVRLSGRPTQVPDSAAVMFEGWLGDKDTMAWPDSPSLYVRKEGPNGRVWEAKLSEPFSRGDVAKKFKTDTMLDTGFKARSNLSALPAGNYRLMLVFSKDGKQHRCDRGWIIQLK